MAKTQKTLTPIEQMAAEVRKNVLEVLIPCDSKKHPIHFVGKVAPLAKAIGVTDPTLRALAEGRSVSLNTITKAQAYFNAQAAENTATEPA